MKLKHFILLFALLTVCNCTFAESAPSSSISDESEVAELVVKLEDADATVRGLAAGRLIALRGDYAVNKVRELLVSGSANARIALAAAIQFAGDERYIDGLIGMLEAKEEEVAGAARQGLSSFAGNKILTPLRDVLLNKTKTVQARARAAELLGGITEKEAVVPLLLVLDDDVPELERVVFDSLRNITYQVDIPNERQAWSEWWKENEDKSREEWLIQVIQGLKKKVEESDKEIQKLKDELSQLLIAQLEEDDVTEDPKPFIEAARRYNLPQLQLVAIDELGKLTGETKEVKEAVEVLVALLSVGGALEVDPEVIAQACISLGKIGDPTAKEPLLKQLYALRVTVRAAAARALGAEVFKGPEVVKELVRLLGDDAETVREASCSSLGKLKAAEASPQLRSRLEEDPAGSVRAEALKALAEIGDVSAIAAICKSLLTDPQAPVRYRAAEGLGRLAVLPGLPDEERTAVVESLSQALKADKDQGVRPACALALGKIGNLEAVPALQEALGDPYVPVQDRSWEALLAITQKHPEQLAKLAGDMIAKNQLQRATEAYELLLEKFSPLTEHEKLVLESRSKLASCYVVLGRLTQAMDHYVQLVPGSAEAWPSLIAVLKDMCTKEQYTQVRGYVEELKQKDPKLGGEEISKQIQDIEDQCNKELEAPKPPPSPPAEPPTS